MSADKYPSMFSRQMEAIVYFYHKSDDKIGRPRSEIPICLSQVCLQTELDDTKSHTDYS